VSHPAGRRQTKRILEEHLKQCGIFLRRSAGQSFLIDQNLLAAIAASANLDKETVVLEVGAGSGLLTRLLAERAGVVIAVEVDERLMGIAQEFLADFRNIRWVRKDFLPRRKEISPEVLAEIRGVLAENRGSLFKVVCNPPYSIASPMMISLLECALPLKEMLLVIQKEVAQRLTAKPRSRGYGVLTVLVQSVADVRFERAVPSSVFWPRPRVDSALVRITPNPGKQARILDRKVLSKLTCALFEQRRKTLRSSMKKQPYLMRHSDGIKECLSETGLDLSQRPEELDVETFVEISNRIAGGSIEEKERPGWKGES